MPQYRYRAFQLYYFNVQICEMAPELLILLCLEVGGEITALDLPFSKSRQNTDKEEAYVSI